MRECFTELDGDGAGSATPTEQDRRSIALVEGAIARGDVRLAYQPVVQARDTARPAFYEGLIRVLDETGRVIPAADFIAALEMTDIGRQIDCLALDLGLAELSRQPTLRLSINMSTRSIGEPRWLKTLADWLASDPTLGERLILEITEASAVLLPGPVARFMDDLKAHGICFALDDFGAGYTAFRYFKELPFDILKIDGQFIRGIHQDAANQTLTRAMISIARHFEMFTVAEFVETELDADYLTALGIDCMQGYHFGKPALSPAALEVGAGGRAADRLESLPVSGSA